ncbi:hypothetical protein KIN20_007148 [Parelaphostrongylus tenuis]|uniref:Uncharacterized protein n=1 Tax=Parelaphostrongylus tenuis TaxID=148309 RepID=A0AAD5M2X1_PARTN|nr:hypothetical protein KIN20_007148 [Parelaphostrongylus tenuis]
MPTRKTIHLALRVVSPLFQLSKSLKANMMLSLPQRQMLLGRGMSAQLAKD